MKVFALMGSPRAGSNSEVLLDKYIEGAISTGAVAEKLCIGSLKILPCSGCMDCRKTGRCEEKEDDVSLIAKMVEEADAIIVSTPIYGNHLPGQFKMLFDRLTGLTHMSRMQDGKLLSVSRLQIKKRNLALVAVAGSPLPESCDQALRYLARIFLPELNDGTNFELRATGVNGYKQISMNHEALTEYVRALRYPNVEETVEKMIRQNDEYLKHAYDTGKELILSLKSS